MFDRKKYNKAYKKSLNGKYRQAISMAKWRGLVFKISFEDYKCFLKQPCFYCNKKTTGLDRINNKKGYLLENVLPSCRTCNILRNDLFTVEETQVMVKALIKYRRSNG